MGSLAWRSAPGGFPIALGEVVSTLARRLPNATRQDAGATRSSRALRTFYSAASTLLALRRRRLDGMASLLATPGYRGSAIDREDLRTALDDIDLPVSLRFAAARLLAKIDPEIRRRVVEAADTSPSATHAKLLRICDAGSAEVAQAYADVEAAEAEAGIRSLRGYLSP